MPTSNPIYWIGSGDGSDPKCDLAEIPGLYWDHSITDTFVDGKTSFGPWAVLCPVCSENYSIGIGTGRGQEYQKQPDGRWMKIGG